MERDEEGTERFRRKPQRKIEIMPFLEQIDVFYGNLSYFEIEEGRFCLPMKEMQSPLSRNGATHCLRLSRSQGNCVLKSDKNGARTTQPPGFCCVGRALVKIVAPCSNMVIVQESDY